ncbi:MAG: hypothetical protein IKZ42_02645 [Clostridiales bacterium]|nr:hypothetical protein [Clostridiales bacterium]
MSNVRDRGVIDIILVDDGKYVLVILDDMKWEPATRQQHGHILQDKINDYLDYIASGQAEEAKPGLRPVIRIIAQYSYSQFCIDFLERVRAFIKAKDDICDIEWTHSSEDGPFDDGFSDDFVFDETKIYPRIKKNWARDPQNEVSMMPPDASASDYPDNMVMIRVMDSFIGVLVQDMGSVLTYLTYDNLPEGADVMELWNKAFENLCKDINYRWSESKEPGIYGILAGGDFEAESLYLDGVWKNLADSLGDDLIICVPTKDIFFYTKAGEKKLVKKLLKMAADMFERNQKETPYLLFCKDVFIYDRKKECLEITKKYSY